MTEEVEVAQEATDEVVQTEVEQTEAPEAAESTEGRTDESPADGDEKPEDSKEKLSRHQRRKAQMAALRDQAKEAESKLDTAKQRLERLKEAAQGRTPPKQDDFDNYDDYILAKGAWSAGQEFDRRDQEQIQREADDTERQFKQLRQQEQAEAQQNWADQSVEARKRYKDFDAVVSAPDVPITPQMAQLIQASDVGADVAYYLGTNKAVAMQIARLSPLEQAMEVGRLSATVSRPKPRTQTNAPDPIAPVTPKATGSAKDPSKMSMAEYQAWRKRGAK